MAWPLGARKECICTVLTQRRAKTLTIMVWPYSLLPILL